MSNVRYDLSNTTNRSQTNYYTFQGVYIILDVQLLSKMESVAAVPAEMESEQEDLHEERIFLVAEVNINNLFRRCSLCGNPIIHTEETTREHF